MGTRRDAVELAGIRAALALATALPEPAARGLGRSLGRAAHAFGVRRSVARDNVARAFAATHSVAARHAIVRQAYAHLGESFIEFLALSRTSAAALGQQVDITGLEHLRGALAGGRGAIVASGHLGNWEVMGAAVATLGFPVTFVVQPLRNRSADALVNDVRRSTGVEVLQRGMALRRVEAALGANRLLFFMCDQDARRRGTFVPFFGVPASTPKGAAQLAVRHQVPFVPAFGWRTGRRRHHVELSPPLVPSGTDEDTAVQALLVEFTAQLEAAIRRAPEQYWWAHRRWKTKPPETQAR